MGNKLKPALIGGLIVGILSAISSQIPFVGFCCCLWSLGGGAVAGLLYIKGSPTRVSVGDGAMVGALAGVVGGLLYLIIVIPISLFIGAAAIQAQLANAGVRDLPFSGSVLLIVGAIISAVILIILSTLGGVLSVPIFEKRKDDAVPPPPPAAGGMGGYTA
jgi:hypothetical protein